MNMLSMSDFKTCSNASVFALVNQEDKRIYLSQSSNTILAISQLCEKLKKGVFHIPDLIKDYSNGKLEIVVLYEEEDDVLRKIRLRQLQDSYSKASWFLYNRFKSSRYRIRMYLKGSPSIIELWMVSASGHNKFFVAAFNNMHDADEFIKKYYSNDNPIPVYGENELSRELSRKYNTKVLSK